MRRVSLVTAIVLLAGCIETDPAQPIDDRVEGRYVLRSIDNDPVPATFSRTDALTIDFMSGVLTLVDDLTFTDSTELRREQVGDVSRRVFDVATGTYVVRGDTVRLSSTRGERYYMTFQADRSLLQELGGVRLIYRR